MQHLYSFFVKTETRRTGGNMSLNAILRAKPVLLLMNIRFAGIL